MSPTDIQHGAVEHVPAGGDPAHKTAYAIEVTGDIAVTTALADDTVWIATQRKDVAYHRIVSDTATACRRSTRTGHRLPRATVIANHNAQPCGACWDDYDPAAAAPR